MLSLGSTGFTTVEEMESANPDALQENCFDVFWSQYEHWMDEFDDREFAFILADIQYDTCLNNGGCQANC